MKGTLPPGVPHAMNRKGKRGGGCKEKSPVAASFGAVRSDSRRNEGLFREGMAG